MYLMPLAVHLNMVKMVDYMSVYFKVLKVLTSLWAGARECALPERALSSADGAWPCVCCPQAQSSWLTPVSTINTRSPTHHNAPFREWPLSLKTPGREPDLSSTSARAFLKSFSPTLRGTVPGGGLCKSLSGKKLVQIDKERETS